MRNNLTAKSLLLSAAMLGASFSVWGQEFQQGNLKYTVNADNTTVSVAAASRNSSDALVIPSTVTDNGKTYTVTAVKESGFAECKFTSILIPKTVTEIGSCGFQYCSNTKSITFEAGSKLTYVADHTFKGCSLINEFELPEGVTAIGDWALESMTGLYALTLPSTLTKIGSGAIGLCPSLGVVTVKAAVPPTVRENVFREDPFATCTLLVPQGAVSKYSFDAVWGQFANIKAGSYRSFTTSDFKFGVTDSGVVTVIDYLGKNTVIDIPEKVTYEGIQYTVNALGPYLFYKSGISSVTIPSTVKIIGPSVFESCKSLEYLTIPNGVERIGAKAFNYSEIKSFILPNSVKHLGEKLFPMSTRVLELSKNLKELPLQVCAWSQITEIVVPEGVTTICKEAFVRNAKLTTVILPTTLTTLEEKTFGDSPLITKVICGSTKAPAGGSDNTFSDEVYKGATLYVPTGSSDSYRKTAPWSMFKNIEEYVYSADNEFTDGNLRYRVIDKESVKVIGVAGNPASVTIPDELKFNALDRKVVEIADNAFAGSTVKSVVIGRSVKAIGNNSFGGLNMTSVKVLPSDPPVCPDNAFTEDTYRNATLTVGSQLRVYYMASSGWSNFKNIVEQVEVGNKITMGNFVYTILENQRVEAGFTEMALKDKSITEIIIPDMVNISGKTYTVTAIAPKGFYALQCPDTRKHIANCTGTVRVVLPETIKEIGEEAFGYAHVSTINLPNSLTTLGKGCFHGCLMTNDIVIPGGVVEIPVDAFSWIWYVNKLTLSEGVEKVGKSAFGSSRFAEVYIPASLYEIGSLAFDKYTNKVEVADLESFLNISFFDYWSNPLYPGADLYCKGKPVNEINFGDYSMTTVGKFQLYGCNSLTKVVFPRNFTEVGYRAFYDAKNLRTVECMNPDCIITDWHDTPFSAETTDKGTLYIPVGSKNAYVTNQKYTIWATFKNIVETNFGGVEGVEADNNSITVSGNTVVNPDGISVKVYDVAGNIVYEGTENVITLASGFYLVAADNKTVKIFIN
ncbi:MAG: leucine-rich repeat domain-containing protein [Muribaculaceae bacterium]|nr:leucine-rich repeat domain-containing protein [Muribaculaceae bacterium]